MDTLTDIDRMLIQKSQDLHVTRKRTLIVLLFGVLVVALLVAARLLGMTELIFWASLVYVVITTLDKASYGFAVRLYKQLITKLHARVLELEGGRR